MEPNTPAKSQMVPQQKAVIFTHFGGLQYGKDYADWLNKKDGYLRDYTEIIQSYLQCANDGNQVGLVYVYIDWAIRQAVPKITRKAFNIDAKHLGQETELSGLLEFAEEEARGNLGLGRDHPPRFRYVGLVQLVNLLNTLIKVDPKLVKLLGGLGARRFTYDSPKFAEAVIRLARPSGPVIRIDEDATPTAGFIRQLLESYAQISKEKIFYFFSGAYGDPAGGYDPINDHAVRVHWLANVPQHSRPKLTAMQTRLARTFLADLNLLGATQIQDSQKNYSKVGVRLASSRPQNQPSRHPQVISGAGLIMSPNAIRLFPPFMNFKNLTVWVDDHLKRRLHEAAGDLATVSLESLAQAKIQQMRHLRLAQDDIHWARTNYFDRLLRGCLLTSLIIEFDGKPTEYAKLLTDIANNGVGKGDVRVSRPRLERLRKDLVHLARKRYKEAEECWRSPEFTGTAICEWAGSLPKTHSSTSCREVARDALRYVDLLLEWPIFTNAISRLEKTGNYWLFVPAS